MAFAAWLVAFCPALVYAQSELSRKYPASLTLPKGIGAKIGTLSEKDGAVVLATKDGNYTLSNGKEVLASVTEKNFPLHLETEKPKGAGQYYLSVKKFASKSAGEWKQDLEDAPKIDRQTLGDLNADIVALGTKTKNNIMTPAESQDWEGVLANYRETRGKIATVYANVQDPATRANLAKLNANMAVEERTILHNKLTEDATSDGAKTFVANLPAVEKRFYRLNDNYRPEIYPLINKRCSSCVAIVQKNGAVPLGSGVIIGDDVVLTAQHNIGENTATSFAKSEYVVWTDYEERRFDNQLANTVCECQEIYRSPKLDFVLLKIRRADNKNALGRPAIAIYQSRVQRWTPIFLVGYPQGGHRTVHDSSWILFPHHIVNNKEWGEIESAITEEYLQEDSSVDRNVAKARAGEKARTFMTSHYGDFDPAQQKPYILHADGAEYIGAECDTFEGDSGAPAMLREGGALIGILFKGESDAGASANTDERKPKVSSRPGAQFHERILPATLMIEELDINLPQWRDFGVKVE